MGFLDYGSAKSLGYRHDYGRDIDRLYEREAYRKGVDTEKARITQRYASLMKEPTAVASSNIPRLEEHLDGLNDRVADFMIKHGQAIETDVSLQQEFMRMTDGYINNDIVREDMQAQQQLDVLKNAVNNNLIDEDSAQQEFARYDEYEQNGGDPYVFSGIKKKVYSDILKESAAFIQPTTTFDDQGNRYMDVTAVTPEAYLKRAYVDFSDPNNAKEIQRVFDELPPDAKAKYDNAIDMHVKILQAGEWDKTALAAWDPDYMNMLKSSDDSREKLLATSPWFAQQLAPKWKVGNQFMGTEPMLSFTPFHKESRNWDLGNQGTEVWVDNDDPDLPLRKVTLRGELQATNIKDVKIEADGAYIKVDVKTNVNPNKLNVSEPIYSYKERNEHGQVVDMSQEDFTKKLNEVKRDKNKRDIEDGINKEDFWRETSFQVPGDEDYTNAGFTSKGVQIPGLVIPGVDAQKSVFPEYSGSIWIKANVTDISLAEYEKKFGGQSDTNKAKGRLAADQIIRESILNENYGFALQVMRDTYGGEWEQDPNNPAIFIEKNTE